MRARDLDALADADHDVLVIGGGIYGLAIAADAASRGLTVALVDASDFGSGASFNHQKTAHGGLRSLQSGNLVRARDAIRERRALARIAPRLLRPLPFIIGTYRSLTRSRPVLRAAFRIDRWLGRDRNEGVEPELHLPPPRLVSRAATLKLFPGILREGLTGGAMWYDYQMVEADRLTIAFAAAADAYGARLANHADAIEVLKDGGAVAGMRVRDRPSGRTFDVRARVTINAAGARAGDVMRAFGVNRPLPLLRAINLVTRRPASDIALAARGRSGRMLTLVPWRGRALIGTSQTPAPHGQADALPEAADIDAFIADANVAFPALQLTRDEVTLVHRGLVPARESGQADLLSSPRIIDHAQDGVPGALTVLAVKYTTARGVAARAVSHAARMLRRSVPPSRTDRQSLPGAAIADHEALAIETAREVALEIGAPIVRNLTAVYGDRCAPIIRLMAERSDWRMPLEPGRPTVGAEVIYAIRDEMALTLGDVLIRRTGLGADGRPSEGIVQAAARIAAEELGWTDAQMRDEIHALDAFYRVP